MPIGRGIIHIDDYYKFGKMLDSLAKLSYSIQYVPHKSTLIITSHKSKLDEIDRVLSGYGVLDVEVVVRGGLAFVKAKW